VDTRQINLTRFAPFFPEKRDFFLKDSDIFKFGRIGGRFSSQVSLVDGESGRPYFSRKIGLSPDSESVDLDYGGKLSGRIGQWDFGAQYIRQAPYRLLLISDDKLEGGLQSSGLKIRVLEIKNHNKDEFKAQYVYSKERLTEDFPILY